MKRTFLATACLACLALAACGDSSASKKPITRRDQSAAPKFVGSGGESVGRMVAGPDQKKP